MKSRDSGRTPALSMLGTLSVAEALGRPPCRGCDFALNSQPVSPTITSSNTADGSPAATSIKQATSTHKQQRRHALPCYSPTSALLRCCPNFPEVDTTQSREIQTQTVLSGSVGSCSEMGRSLALTMLRGELVVLMQRIGAFKGSQ